MNIRESRQPREEHSVKLLSTLERLLALEASSLTPVFHEAATLIAEAVEADKVDTFVLDPTRDTLAAIGTSTTPMGVRQKALGLDLLPLSNGGRAAGVFQTGDIYHSGRVDEDHEELLGVRQGLGIRSQVIVPLVIGGTRRGAIAASSAHRDAFTPDDVLFLRSVAHWIGLIMQRAELVEGMARDATEEGRRLAAEELVTVLAHDLGNYLTPLAGRVSMLRLRAEREARTADLVDVEHIARSLERFRRLIVNLLDVARLEQGLFALAPEPVDVAELVREITNLTRVPGVEIAVQAPTELIVPADADRLRQALENLIGNAVKYTPEGHMVTVEVTDVTREDGTWVTFTVRDQGPGIEPDLVPHLFQRFAKGPRSTGIGIGLYLTRGIAEAHGGTLTVASTYGHGTAFCLSLPIGGD